MLVQVGQIIGIVWGNVGMFNSSFDIVAQFWHNKRLDCTYILNRKKPLICLFYKIRNGLAPLKQWTLSAHGETRHHREEPVNINYRVTGVTLWYQVELCPVRGRTFPRLFSECRASYTSNACRAFKLPKKKGRQPQFILYRTFVTRYSNKPSVNR